MGEAAMKISVGDYFAKCPYCGSMEFLPGDDPASEPHELACADCGGYASRQVVLDRIGDEATLRAEEALDRLRKKRDAR